MDFVLGGRTDRGDLQARDGVDPDDFYSAMCYTEGRAPHALDDCSWQNTTIWRGWPPCSSSRGIKSPASSWSP